ncbi:G-protein coupled receptor dmsr-1-like [Haliotis cracherodii]|uniref:G-protein coupled receptor dmsr-1-like n=1 Tax=Haliotis cracherodii TaxID=6455 RepID=UPI0039E753F0
MTTYSGHNTTGSFLHIAFSPYSPLTTVSPNMTTEPTQGSEGPNCTAKYIPGVLSESAAIGLESFSSSYGHYHGYVSAIVCFFGMMANIANIIVLTRKNMISSTNTILMWLAVADLLTMMSYFPFAIHFYILRDPQLQMFHTLYHGWIWFLMFHANFSIVCHTVAIWLTIALAIFRYIYICMPTRGMVYCSLRRAKITIFVVYFLTFIICIPNYVINRIHEMTREKMHMMYGIPMPEAGNGTGNHTQDLVYSPYQWRESEVAEVILQINNWIQAIFIKLIPCVMLMTLTILLVHAMHKAYRKRMRLKSEGRKAESDKHGEHNRTTGMLLAVVALFMITELPQGLLSLMNIFIPCFQDMVYNRLGDLLDIMALLNNSINFVLYCTMSKQFRDTFMEVFCKVCTKNKPGWLKLKVVSSTNGNSRSSETTNHTHV